MVKKERQWPNTCIWITLTLFSLFICARIYYRLTDDFRIANMTYEMPYNPGWEIPPLKASETRRIKNILNQPFTYLGKGAQSYVFASEDKQHVIKFFKFKHIKPKWWMEAFASVPFLKTFYHRQSAKKKRQLNGVFFGYKLAYDVHQEETGIVFLHLNKTTDWNQQVTILDKIRRKHVLPLDPTVFIIQKNAKVTRQEMQEALDNGNLPLAKKRISQIFDLYLKEYAKGIYDRDHGVLHNTGFFGDQPVHLDVGKLSKDLNMKKPQVHRADLEKIRRKFELWLKDQYPKESQELAAFMEEKFTEIFGENAIL